MGFLPSFDGPGPREDQPRKTGVFRLWETLSRDFWDLFRAGLLALLGCVPFFLGVGYGVVTHTVLLAPVLGLAGGALAGPGLCGLADTALRGLRDEPGLWWLVYRRAWRRNARASLLPGALGGMLLGTQGFLLANAGALRLGGVTLAALAAGILLVLALSLYLWPQLALMDLPFPQLVKNSALLFLGRLPRSLAALVILTGYLWLVLRYLPVALPFLPLANLWLPVLPALFLIYPNINETFHIEEKLGGN